MLARRLIPALLAAAAVAAPLAAHARAWTLNDTTTTKFIDDVRISPDGTHALIDVATADAKTNTFAETESLVTLSDGTIAPMPAGLHSPRWSPGGSTIAWLRPAKSGADAIVITNARGASLHALTAGARSVLTFAWSPDGRHIAAVETALAAASNASRVHWMTPESDYRNTAPLQRNLYVIDVASKSERALTRDSWSYGGPVTDHDPSWSADGSRIASVRQPSPLYGDFEHAQYVTIDVRSGAVHDIVGHAFFAYPGSVPPLFAPTGDAIAFAHTWDGLLPSREDLYVGDRDVTASLDRDLWSCGAGSAQWQSTDLIAGLMDGVSIRLYRVGPAGAAPQALTSRDGSVEAFSAAPGGRIAYSWATPTTPTELYVLDPGKAPRQITHIATLHDLPVATTRYVEWNAPDGRTLHGQLTLPLGVDPASAPLVVEPHGGPQCSDDSSLDGFAQYFATNGYAFFRPDPRGSDGYGDWSYKAIVGNWGEGPGADDLAGVDAVLASGVGSKDKLYIEGGSYGGYLTSWITTHDHRFKAAVAEVPVTNLLLEYTLSESPNIVRRFFGAKPALDQALMGRESPITYANDERTPLLVMIGLLDTRAPYAQAIEFYKTVAENGTETRLFADDKAGHGPNDPRGTILWQQAIAAWLVMHGAPAIPDAEMPR
jgi:dipeptidyl aminopeptidase/acylaminoacyl peptidase